MGNVETTLRLRGRGSLLVQVQTSDGTPVNDVDVEASAVPNGLVARPKVVEEETTGSVFYGTPLGGGRYRIGPLPVGRYAVRAHDGRNPPEASNVLVSSGTAETTVVVERNATLNGLVTDEFGKPMPNVWVSARHEAASGIRRSGEAVRVLSDATGAFELSKLSPGARYNVRAEADDGAEVLQASVPAGSSIALQLPRLASLSGSIVDPQGEPVDGAKILVAHLATGRAVQTLSEGGYFQFPRVLPGAVHIHARHGSGTAELSLELAAGRATSSVRLTVQSPILAGTTPQ
jgi:hypothetical protein